MGFLFFLAPVSAVAAINLFSGLGNDFHTMPGPVIWVTGAGAGIACSVGSLAGGFAADRFGKATLYLTGGTLAGAVSVVLALSPHSAAFFVPGVLLYNAIAGWCYAAFTALQIELTGPDNPTAATQMGLFSASTNAAIVYMTWADGQGYRLRGVRGLFLTDGLAAIAAGTLLLLFLRRRRPLAENLVHNEVTAACQPVE
jgi:predicted MFS family arabinose efflux permease